MSSSIATDTAPSGQSFKASAGRWLSRMAPYGMLLLLVLELAVFSFLAPRTFANYANFNVVANNSAILGLITLALLIPLIAGEIDASQPERCSPSPR